MFQKIILKRFLSGMKKSDSSWFTVDKIDECTFVISEYSHWEETHCYLLIGKEKALLIDTGLGVCDISKEVSKLTSKHICAVATHIHWDHIGGHKYYPDFFAHRAELDWLSGKFPLPVETVKQLISKDCILPQEFDIGSYDIFQGKPSSLICDGDTIDLGNRKIIALHTPGHSPGHLCFFEEESGYFFSGDLIYKGMLFANYPSTDPKAYLESLEKVSSLPIKRIFPGHHSLDLKNEIIKEMLHEFRNLDRNGNLHHGAGTFDFGEWSIKL